VNLLIGGETSIEHQIFILFKVHTYKKEKKTFKQCSLPTPVQASNQGQVN
jgi:hypothetical protein